MVEHSAVETQLPPVTAVEKSGEFREPYTGSGRGILSQALGVSQGKVQRLERKLVLR
ncbi:MAG: hypothetical protein HY611_07795 [Elusimicrobia bacterium]|nr:hypothetical protein [Elusimicrobiota bacterium]